MKEITIRAARVEDAAELLAIFAPYVRETAVTFAAEPPTLAEFTEKVRKILSYYPWLVAERDGEIVGYAYAARFRVPAAYDWDVELSIYVKKDCRTEGIGRMLYEKLFEVLDAQGVCNLYVCIATTQTPDAHLSDASPIFHGKMGFTTIAEYPRCGYKFDRWYDMIWMQRQKETMPVPPAPTLSFDAVRERFSL